jgi:hypothetical protein
MTWFVSAPSFSISAVTVSFRVNGTERIARPARTMLVRPPQPVPQ